MTLRIYIPINQKSIKSAKGCDIAHMSYYVSPCRSSDRIMH